MFVIQRADTEYNDEITSISNGGNPIEIVKTKGEAIRKVAALQAQELSGLNVSQYAYDLGDVSVFTEEELDAKFREITEGNHGYRWEENIPKDLSQDELLRVSALFNLQFFSYVEVPVT